MSSYEDFIHISRYARHLHGYNCRETWSETVTRLTKYWNGRGLDNETSIELYEAILNKDVMPSMRSLMTAGEALDRDNVAGYNCSYVAVDSPYVFDEAMYVLMCGTGLGFSVERQFINQLPVVGESKYEVEQPPKVDVRELSYISDNSIIVEDSKYGWASALRLLVSELYRGNFSVTWDTSKVRPAGAILKTFGGRASGAQPLEDLFYFFVEVFKKASGRKLSSIECHDLMCKIAEVVVVGGVRRSALISLSNLTDERMRKAKSGDWWINDKQRALANNSVCYTEKPDIGIFMREWLSLYESKSGERGIFSRDAANKHIPSRREKREDFGCNPCSEIILRSKQFCNLTEVVIRESDGYPEIKDKIEKAVILGTLQSTLTDLVYLSYEWTKNTEEERLLGVSLTGIADNPLTANPSEKMLEDWRDYAIEVNKKWAEKLRIPPSKAITCVKPSGTVSQLVDCSSGIHPRYSKYYIRTVRGDKKDPLCIWMKEQGVPCEDDVMKPDSTYVFSFPMKSPSTSVMRDDVSAIEQLELWKKYALHWCEHKPSITVYVKEHEWLEVGSWVYENFDIMSGVSFLPHTDHIYPQAPYQEIDEETYEKLVKEMPRINFSAFREDIDNTTSSQELACAGGACEIL